MFDAELYAVVMAIKQAAQRGTIRNQRVVVFTDSQATLTRIQSDQEGPGQNLTKMLFHWEQRLEARGANIEYRWVPAHKGVPGNERADYLAKFATEMRTYAWYGEHAAFVEQRSLANANRSAKEKQFTVDRQWLKTDLASAYQYRQRRKRKMRPEVKGWGKRDIGIFMQMASGHTLI